MFTTGQENSPNHPPQTWVPARLSSVLELPVLEANHSQYPEQTLKIMTLRYISPHAFMTRRCKLYFYPTVYLSHTYLLQHHFLSCCCVVNRKHVCWAHWDISLRFSFVAFMKSIFKRIWAPLNLLGAVLCRALRRMDFNIEDYVLFPKVMCFLLLNI